MGQWLSERLGQPFIIEVIGAAGRKYWHRGGRGCACRRIHAAHGRSRVLSQDKLSFKLEMLAGRWNKRCP